LHPIERAIFRPSFRGLCRSGRGTNLGAVQRLFVIFPRGTAGIGLFLLRSAVAAFLVLEVLPDFTAAGQGWKIALGLILTGLFVLGVFTPYLCALCFLAEAGLLVTGDTNRFQLASVMIATAALGLTGPGGYSWDAQLFGPRLVLSTEEEVAANGEDAGE
jgi:hypothetical protein